MRSSRTNRTNFNLMNKIPQYINKGSKNGLRKKKMQKLREYLAERDGLTCCYCGGLLDYGAKEGSKHFITIEHIIPKYLGGSNLAHNLKLSCKPCNNNKIYIQPANNPSYLDLRYLFYSNLCDQTIDKFDQLSAQLTF